MFLVDGPSKRSDILIGKNSIIGILLPPSCICLMFMGFFSTQYSVSVNIRRCRDSVYYYYYYLLLPCIVTLLRAIVFTSCVYLRFGVKLTDGRPSSTCVALEPTVLRAFRRFKRRPIPSSARFRMMMYVLGGGGWENRHRKGRRWSARWIADHRAPLVEESVAAVMCANDVTCHRPFILYYVHRQNVSFLKRDRLSHPSSNVYLYLPPIHHHCVLCKPYTFASTRTTDRNLAIRRFILQNEQTNADKQNYCFTKT